MINVDGKQFTDPQDILVKIREFYKNLYTNDETLNENFTLPDLPTLSVEDQELCEGIIHTDKAYEVLKSMPKNRRPGNDGLPYEIYYKCWDVLGVPLVESLNYSFENGYLTESQRQAIITLLSKTETDREYLKNWRPVSLLNCDFKLLTKCLTERLKMVIKKIVYYL